MNPIVILPFFVLDWFAIALNWRQIKYLSKPFAMALIIGWTLSTTGFQPGIFIILLLSAQVMGLAGDVFLLFPQRWFFWGLIAFLCGHVLYGILLVRLLTRAIADYTFALVDVYFVVICFGIWLIVMLGFYKILDFEGMAAPASKFLWVACQFYALILSGLVVFSVLLVRISLITSVQSLMLPIGASLFLTSDFLLAYDRFKKHINNGQLIVRITYHLAQISMAIGFVAMIR